MSKRLVYEEDAIEAICKACSMEGDYHKCDGYPETSTWCDELVALRALPSAQLQLDAEFAEAVRMMFANVWECEIDHPKFQDTVGEILEKVIELHNSVPPMKLDEWCDDCAEYDKTTHSCPRFNRVIRTTLDDVRKEAIEQRDKGKWIEIKHDDIQTGRAGTHECFCSRCGATGFGFYKYCPNCGTKMEEGYERKNSNH